MTLTIYKYQLPICTNITMRMPSDAKILSFQIQHDTPTIWVIVDTDNIMKEKNLLMLMTGHPIDQDLDGYKYIGTSMTLDHENVAHLFEKV